MKLKIRYFVLPMLKKDYDTKIRKIKKKICGTTVSVKKSQRITKITENENEVPSSVGF